MASSPKGAVAQSSLAGTSRPTRRDVLRYSAAGSLALAAGGLPGAANSAAGPFKIALSNAYIGNEWRSQQAAAFERAAEGDEGKRRLRHHSAVHGSDNSVPAQLAAIADMILKENDGIMVNCSSGSQVGGAVEQAADAGIKVVSFDAYASSDRSWNIGFDFGSWGRNNAEFVEKRLGGAGKAQGNVLIVTCRSARPPGSSSRRISDDAGAQSGDRSCSAKWRARRPVLWRSAMWRRSFQASQDRRGARRGRQQFVRHRRGDAGLGLHDGEHAADLHGRRRRLYPVVARGARQARLRATGLNADPAIGGWATYYMAQILNRRRQRAEGVVRALGPHHQ